MGYESNDVQEFVSTIKLSDFSELRTSTIKGKDGNLKSVDIRNWYCTQKEPEMKPNQKGVRIKKEDLAEVLIAILENIDDNVKSELSEKGFSFRG